MKLVIEELRGVWRVQVDSRSEFAGTLEELLLKIAPQHEDAHLWAAAEVLGGILGAQVVEIPHADEELFSLLGEYAAQYPTTDEFLESLGETSELRD